MPAQAHPTGTGTVARAVLWDLDGTLVESAPLWRAAYLDLATELGAPLGEGLPPGVWRRLAGRTIEASVVELTTTLAVAGHVDVSACADRLVDLAAERLASGDVDLPWRPGAEAALTLATTLGLRCALVTSSWRAAVTPVLAHLGVGFDAVVCGDEVTNGKPDPEGYLRAAARLGVPAAACVAVEDSPTGAAAAAAAGARVVVVPSDPGEEFSPVHTVRRSLHDLGAADLGRA